MSEIAGAEALPKPNLRRIILPIIMVLGTFLCGYTALFVGVKEDLPAPAAAARYPLSLVNQNLVKDQFPVDTQNYKIPDIAVYVLRDTPEEAAAYWRNAFVAKRGWKELPAPAQPRDRGPVDFTTLGFLRAGSKVILAIAPADKLLSLDNDFTRSLKTAPYRSGDTVAILIAGDLK